MLVVILLLRLGFWCRCLLREGFWMLVVVSKEERRLFGVWLSLRVDVMLLLWGVLFGSGVGFRGGGGVSGETRGGYQKKRPLLLYGWWS